MKSPTSSLLLASQSTPSASTELLTGVGFGGWQAKHSSQVYQSLTADISPRGRSCARALFGWQTDEKNPMIKCSNPPHPHYPCLTHAGEFVVKCHPLSCLFQMKISSPGTLSPGKTLHLCKYFRRKDSEAGLKRNPSLSSRLRSPAKAATAPLLYFPGEKEILPMAGRQLCQCFLLIPSTGSNFSCGKIHQS